MDYFKRNGLVLVNPQEEEEPEEEPEENISSDNPDSVTEFPLYNGNDDNFDRAREERQGLDSAVIFIALGDELFVSLMKGLDEVRQGNKERA